MDVRTGCPLLKQSQRRFQSFTAHGVASCAQRPALARGVAWPQQGTYGSTTSRPGQRVDPAPQRRCRIATAAAAAEAQDGEELLTPGDLVDQGAEQLQAFLEGLSDLDLPEEVLGGLLAGNPALVLLGAGEVRGRLEALAGALGLGVAEAGRLAARVPALWDVPPQEVAARAGALASELRVGVGAAVELWCAQPGLWAVEKPSIIHDRLDSLALKLALPVPEVVALVGRQPLLWVVQPTQVATSVRGVSERLGLSGGEAAELVARVPPVVAAEGRLLQLSIGGVCGSTGLQPRPLMELLGRSLGLVAVPTPLLTGALEGLAADLGAGPEDALGLITRQPTLLCAQLPTLLSALEVLETSLQVDRRTALAVLCDQPALLYDFTIDTAVQRVESLAATFSLSLEEARSRAVAQPAVLAVAPSTLRSATSVIGMKLGASLAGCLDMLTGPGSQPGAYVMASFQGSLVEAWSSRLGLEADDVMKLLTQQPALLELTPTTVKARLESLAALFQAPLEIVVQLVLKHPALAAIPPNVTITRAKNLSMALRVSLGTAANIIAKEPALLGVLAHHSAEMRDKVDDVMEVNSIREYYTLEWLQRQIKEMKPTRMTSFSSLDK